MTAGDPLQQRLDQALALCQSGALDEAERLYRSITAEHPDAPDAWNMLAVVLYQQSALDGAAQASEHATALRPAIAPYWLMRGNIAFARKDLGGAQAYFSRAAEIAPTFAEAHYRLGLALHAGFRYADAIAAYRRALAYAREIAEIHWQLAEALIAEGAVEDAMRAYQEAFTRDPGDTLDRRGALDWLGRLHFPSLPPAWHAELERFFSEARVDVKPYVGAGLKALSTKACFRRVLDDARGSAGIRPRPALDEAMRNPLLHALLRAGLIADPGYERWLTRLRAALLVDETLRLRAPLDFLCALALQSFNNEYVFYETPQEIERVAALRSRVESRLASGQPQDDGALRAALTLACYRRLDALTGVDRLLAHDHSLPALRTLLERSVIEPRAERALRDAIPSIVQTGDAVSQEVRGMYEEHPYPRWFAIDREPAFPLAEWIERELPARPAADAPRSPRTLVAGCGTGRDAIWIAVNIAGATVLGVDLSLSSLSYARRQASRMGAANVEFVQGDILGLPAIDERFDLIASTGVLHHMRDPLAGLRAVAGLLKPGGYMKLGFYSRRARVAVTAAREIIAREGIAATESAMRAFRQRVFSEPPDSALKELECSNDFYSMSMCRDLIFHVQEHQYTLPELGAMLRELGLEFMGLSELPQDTVARYRKLYPHDPLMVDIKSWDAYERQYPDTFSRMFLFWCRKVA